MEDFFPTPAALSSFLGWPDDPASPGRRIINRDRLVYEINGSEQANGNTVNRSRASTRSRQDYPPLPPPRLVQSNENVATQTPRAYSRPDINYADSNLPWSYEPQGPEVNRTQRRPSNSLGTTPEYLRLNRPKRKYGPVEFQRFDHLVASQARIGSGTLDKVKVNCKLLFSKTKWGTLGAGSPAFSTEAPAGIMYMDLDFDQPKDCKLSSATVTVTLDDQAPEVAYFRSRNRQSYPRRLSPTTAKGVDRSFAQVGCPVQITDWFGPKAITGGERNVEVTDYLSVKPTVGFANISLGGMGYEKESTKTKPSRWTFSGRTIAGNGGRKDGYSSGNDFLYKGLRWTLTENDLEPQAAHSAVMHTAFAFVHSGEPVLLRVQIEGKLKGLGARVRNRLLEFPRASNRNDNLTSTLINLSDCHVFVLPLDEHARGLEFEMQMANLAANPIEVPDPMPASFRDSPPIAEPLNNGGSLKDTVATTLNDRLQNLAPSGSRFKYVSKTPAQTTNAPAQDESEKGPRVCDHLKESISEPSVEDLVSAFSEIVALSHERPKTPEVSLVTAQENDAEVSREANGDGVRSGDAIKDSDKHEISVHSLSLRPFTFFTSSWITTLSLWNWILWLTAMVMPDERREVHLSAS